MLIDFQQALADLTASPELCNAVRADASVLRSRYQLGDAEQRRLLAIVRHPGMTCACIVYRANRLAPLALNLPRTCRALGDDLRDLASDYWRRFPEGNVHFFVETERFCTYLEAMAEAGADWAPRVGPLLALEASIVRAGLRESRLEAA